ncbi:hypothetical protein LTR15_009774 [Elasticomyces elasticus]|nr:hypothetical protein LTR15_009774 [Elasticomyces elasticus]
MSTEPAPPSPLEPMSRELRPQPRQHSFVEPLASASGAEDKVQGQAEEVIEGTGLHKPRKSDREPVSSSDQETQSRGDAVTSGEEMRRIIEGHLVVWFVDHVAHNADIPHHSMRYSTANTTSLFHTFSKLLSREASKSRVGNEVARIIREHSGDIARKLKQVLSLPSRQEAMVMLWDDARPNSAVLPSSLPNAFESVVKSQSGTLRYPGSVMLQNLDGVSEYYCMDDECMFSVASFESQEELRAHGQTHIRAATTLPQQDLLHVPEPLALPPSESRPTQGTASTPQKAETSPLDGDHKSSCRYWGYADMQKAQEYLMQHDALQWLLVRIRIATTMLDTGQAEYTVRTKLLRSVNNGPISLVLNWAPRVFLRQQYGGAGTIRLADVFCISGSGINAQATTCAEYVGQMWPTIGPVVLECLSVALKGTSPTYEEALAKGLCRMSVSLSSTYTTFELYGRSELLLEAAEVITWLGSACRASQYPDRCSGCRPYITSELYTERFLVRFDEQSVNETDKAGTCWRKLFKNPVIALGYPIPARKLGEVGLELSLHMMMVLGQTLCAATFAGRSMLKGYNSLFVPTSCVGSSIIWHFLVNEDGSRLPYNDGIAASAAADAYLLDQNTLESGRHFVGWTPAADILAGTKVASYNIERSQSDMSKPAFASLSSINLTISRIVGVGATMVRGKKDIPAALSNQRIYEDQVSSASQWNVLLYDTYERKGWLVDGASALVHLSKAWLSSYVQRQTVIEEANGMPGAEAQRSVFDQLWHSDSFDGHNTALKTLLNYKNRELRLYAKTETKEELSKDLETGKLSRVEKTTKTWWCWEHVVLEKWSLLEQVHDHLVRRRLTPTSDLKLPFGKQSIEGFEFNDAVAGFSPLQPRVTKLESSSGDWLDFSIGIDAITFFGSKFGELIRPASASPGCILDSQCGKRSTCPSNLDYLAVPMSVLAQVQKRNRKRTDGGVQLGEAIFWADNLLSLEDCDCLRSRCKINVAQLQSDSILNRPTTTQASSDEAFQRYPRGAVLFGQRKTVAVMTTSSSHGSKSQVNSDGSSKSKEPVSDSGVDMGEASSSPGSAPDSQTTDSSAPSVVSERPQGSAHSISKSPQRRSLFWLLSFRNSRLLTRNRHGQGG